MQAFWYYQAKRNTFLDWACTYYIILPFHHIYSPALRVSSPMQLFPFLPPSVPSHYPLPPSPPKINHLEWKLGSFTSNKYEILKTISDIIWLIYLMIGWTDRQLAPHQRQPDVHSLSLRPPFPIPYPFSILSIPLMPPISTPPQTPTLYTPTPLILLPSFNKS